ncbi:MAG: CbtA family protein [Micromonosporaceae bacterium]
MTGILPVLGRGVLAGAGGGALAAGFGFLVAEPVIDRAIAYEAARAHEAGEEHAVEVFTRDTQHLGLLVGMIAAGIAFGVLFSLVYAALHRADPGADPWRRSLRLAGAGFLAVYALPYLRYPANPPGVGDPATVDLRTRSWVAAIAIGIVAVALAYAAARQLAHRGVPEPARQLAATGIVVLGFLALFLLPDNPDPIEVAAQPLWDFRLLSAASMLLLWSGIGAGFGLLTGYASRRTVAAPATAPAG